MEHETKECWTIEEVGKHRVSSDFWTVVDNVVYDLSEFHDMHPGGREILMNAAGTDCTILFHQYHSLVSVAKQKYIKELLKKYRIGILVGEIKSANMGDFYAFLAARVRETLEDEMVEKKEMKVPSPTSPHMIPPSPTATNGSTSRRNSKGWTRKPIICKLFWVLDAFMATALLIFSIMYIFDWPVSLCLPPPNGEERENSSSSLWVLCLLHLLVPEIRLRMEGQQHANGHLQIWSPTISKWAELYGYILGVPATFAYGLPNTNKNYRLLLHKPRSRAQFEFTEGRGFAEHVAIHHVSGASLKHDQCYKLASAMGYICLSNQQAYWSIHQFQCNPLYQLILDGIVEFAQTSDILVIHSRVLYICTHLLGQQEYIRSIAIFLGNVSSLLFTWCYLALPLTAGRTGLILYLLILVFKSLSGLTVFHLFFAQHVWDLEIDEKEGKEDWGRHNAASTYSWWPTKLDTCKHTCLWGLWFTSKRGGTPSTLSYHIEHTLFPGLNYSYLPLIAPVVRHTCDKFGIEYHLLNGHSALEEERKLKFSVYGRTNKKKYAKKKKY